MNKYMKILYTVDCDPNIEVQYLEYSATNGETRRVLEVFRDGRRGFADSASGRSAYGVTIPDKPIPKDALSLPESGFSATEISMTEFEEAWSKLEE